MVRCREDACIWANGLPGVPLSLAAGSGHVEAVVARKYGLCKSKRVKKNKVEYAWARCPDVHRCAMPARLQYIVWPAPSSLL